MMYTGCSDRLQSAPAADNTAADSKLQWQWPLTRGVYPALKGITSVFGESRGDHFHNGIDIAAYHKPVHPIAPGQFLYSRSSRDHPFRPMLGSGNVILASHKSGWVSGYFHLYKIGTIRTGILENKSILGTAGNSGRSMGGHLHFFLARSNLQVYVNPFQQLPPITDGNPPVIGQLVLFTSEKRTTRISFGRRENIVLSQAYPIFISISDPGLEKHSRRGIYRLRWELNGTAGPPAIFANIRLKNSVWTLGNDVPFAKTYKNGLYSLRGLVFQDGTNQLRIIAEDFAGNTSERMYDINVRRLY